MSFEIGDIIVGRGERKYGKLGRFYLSDGTGVDIPLMAVRGDEEGPILWISAAMHGQEMSGIPVIWEIIRERLDPEGFRGTVVGAPLLNPFSFNGRTYYTPEDGYNLNRVFPGDPKGLLTHRLAHLIFQEGVKKCDYLIDFHCNVASAMCFSIIKGAQGSEAFRKSKMMADAFGITTIEMIMEHEAHRTGTMAEAAGEVGKPVLVVELVPWRAISETAVDVGVRGVMNIMKTLGMIEGEIEPQMDIPVIKDNLSRLEVNATRGGIIKKLVEVGDPVEKGQVICRIVDNYGDPVEEVTSSVDGWLLAWPLVNNQAVGTGEHVAFLAFKK
jgi:hypothetical protein